MIHTNAVTSEFVALDTQACQDSNPRSNINHSVRITVYEAIVIFIYTVLCTRSKKMVDDGSCSPKKKNMYRCFPTFVCTWVEGQVNKRLTHAIGVGKKVTRSVI